MNLRSTIFLAAIPIVLLLQGCATPRRNTSNSLQNLAYGQTFSEIQKQVGSNVMDCFTIQQTNTVDKCKMIYVDDTQKSYLLLFEDGAFVSMLDAIQERKISKWRGFSSLTQPDFSQANALIEDFFPPQSLVTFQFTNSSNPELAREREKQDRNDAMQMTIELSPLWLPTAPIWIPAMVHAERKQNEWFRKLDSLKTGESEAEVIQLLGKPEKVFGPDDESIRTYKSWWGCLGFENRELVWIMYDYKPVERRRY